MKHVKNTLMFALVIWSIIAVLLVVIYLLALLPTPWALFGWLAFVSLVGGYAVSITTEGVK